MNVNRYEKDLDTLLNKGAKLHDAIQHECSPREFKRVVEESLGDKAEKFIQALPSFRDEYQSWYSEAKALIRQLLPDRLSDFTRYYEKPNSRKSITSENYTIGDYLQGTHRLARDFHDRRTSCSNALFLPAVEPREVGKRTLPELALRYSSTCPS